MVTKNKKQPFDWTSGNSILSKKLNVFGSLFLFLSFTIQTFLFNSWDEKIKIIEQDNRDYTELTRTSLEYQNLYLGLENQGETLKDKFQPVFIKAAAEKYRLGKIISTNVDLFGSKSETQQFVTSTNELLHATNEVNDLNSLYKFVQYAELKIPENQALKTNWIKNMRRKKEIASAIFLTFQIIGSLMLVFGFRYQN